MSAMGGQQTETAMGSRSGNRGQEPAGQEPATYSDNGLRQEIKRAQTWLQIFGSRSSSSLRKLRTSRIHNLEKELERRTAARG